MVLWNQPILLSFQIHVYDAIEAHQDKKQEEIKSS